MKTLFRWLGRILLVLLLAVVLFVSTNWYHFKHFPPIISSYSAKMMCSCMFVSGHEEEYCRNYARQYVPIQKATFDKKTKTVTVKGFWRVNKAKFVNRRFGCALQPYNG
ncbi:MAG: hypothetical protein EP343_12955 [Deltaproteobacteria bacterium]|nr:MAG: hypothetical protein EP343_12955 [Deltaproteobacteria bacterium]